MPQIYAEGLRYHCSAPILSLLRPEKLIDAVAYPVDEKVVFEAAKIFLETEGFLSAPESPTRSGLAIDGALKCKKTGEEKVIAFNISGHDFLNYRLDIRLKRAQIPIVGLLDVILHLKLKGVVIVLKRDANRVIKCIEDVSSVGFYARNVVLTSRDRSSLE